MSLFKIARSIVEPLGFELRKRNSNPFSVQQGLCRSSSPIIFDVGAHTGSVSVKYKELFPGATIYAFEPIASLFDSLVANTGHLGEVKCVRLAMDETTGTKRFNVNRGVATSSLLATHAEARERWTTDLLSTEETIDVDTDTLESFCEREGIDHIDILKIDAQGAEMRILRGAGDMMARRKIDAIYAELIAASTYVGQSSIGEYFAFLEGNGYEVYGVYNAVTDRSGRLLQLDAIFVPSTRLT